MFNFEDPVLKTGANGGEVPPVPIPNTEVKLTSVENTWLETAWEDRAAPVQTVRKLVLYGLFDVYSSGSFGGRYSSLAQSVERSAVNRNVVGSSPTGGAKLIPSHCGGIFFVVLFGEDRGKTGIACALPAFLNAFWESVFGEGLDFFGQQGAEGLQRHGA